MTRILYVEDNDDNVYVLKTRLEMLEGYEVIVAADAEEGLNLAVSTAPDLVLMDLNLPGMNGWDATRQLKADPRTAAIPVIALTAHAMSGDREQALAVGCNEFDTKPIDLNRLLGKMKLVLNR